MTDNVDLLNKVFEGFKINATCIGSRQHRHFSFYDVKLNYGCRISKIMRNSKEIAVAMRAKSDFIVKPIPEAGIIRLQTSYDDLHPLHFEPFYRQNEAPSGVLPLLLGESDEGEPLWLDMKDCPHLLVAGGSGSGKSTLLHTIISNIEQQEDIKLYLVDTKKIEFNKYKEKHFLFTNYNDTISLLKFLYSQMETIYENLLTNIRPNRIKRVLIIDEVSDLMLQQDKTKEFEMLLTKIAQKARAANIFIILATQRPSADIITGLIKANFPARVACKVSSKIDSRVILDMHGAENLNGKGDAIIRSSAHDYVRFQVALT